MAQTGNLFTVDISNPSAITMTYKLRDPWWHYATRYRDMQIIGNRWYYLREDMLSVLDISSPFSLLNLGETTESLSSPSDFVVDGNYAYVCQSASDTFLIFNISNPASIILESQTSNTLFNNCRDIIKVGNNVIIGNSNGEIAFIDVTNVNSPSLTNTFSDASLSNMNNLHYDNNGLVVSASSLVLLDISDPANVLINQTLNKNSSTSVSDINKLLMTYNNNLETFTFKKFSDLGPCTQEGALDYNTTQNVFNVCKDSKLVPLGVYPGAGGAGCSSPSSPKGSLNYDSNIKAYKYCDGTNWVILE